MSDQLPLLWDDRPSKRTKHHPQVAIIFQPVKHKLKKGHEVFASEDIHFGGVMEIERGRRGTVLVNAGPAFVNIQFDKYPNIVLCMYDMLVERANK